MSLDDLQAQLRSAIDQQLAALREHYERAIVETRQEAAAEAQRAADARVAQAQAETEAHLEQLIAGARDQTEQRMRAAAAIERQALEHQLRQQFDRQLQDAVMAAQAAAEQRAREAVATERQALEQQLRQQFEQQVHDAVLAAQADVERRTREAATLEWQGVEQQLRRELAQQHDRHVEQALATARREAEIEREAERKRADNELSEERQRTGTAVAAAIESERQRATSELESERQRLTSELERERQRGAAELENIRQRAASDLEIEKQRAASELEAAQRRAVETESLRRSAESELELHRQRAAVPPPRPIAASGTDLARLEEGVRALDDSRTLTKALDTLTAHAGAMAGRAALFVIDGDRLKAWKAVGIPDAEIHSVDSPIGGRDLLSRAIRAGDALPVTAEAPPPSFARATSERPGLAAPVMIGGRAVAILYVDPGIDGMQPGWPAASGIIAALARHTSTVVALRTAMRTLDLLRGVTPEAAGTGAGDDQSARRFAKLLISEIKLYNEAAVRSGQQQHDLLQRLRPEIDRARRLYEERVPPRILSRHAYFQQELVQTLADGDPALLGNP